MNNILNNFSQVNLEEFSDKVFKFHKSISFKLIIIVTIIISLSLFALGYVINKTVSNRITNISQARNMDVVSLFSREVNSFLVDAENSLIRIRSNYGIRSNNQIAFVARRLFQEELDKSSYFKNIFFVNQKQLVVKPDVEKVKSDYYSSQKEWYKKIKKEREPLWTEAHKNMTGDGYTFTVAVPVYDYSDKFIGVMGGDISLKKLSNMIKWEIGKSGYVLITDDKGQVIAHPDFKKVKTGFNLNNQIDEKGWLNKEKGNLTYKNDKKEYLISYEKFNYGSMIARVPTSEAYAMIDIVRNNIIKVGLIMLVIMILILYFIIDYSLIKPVVMLKDKMIQVEQGELNVTINMDRDDEIGILGQCFNSMTSNLQQLIKGINQTSNKLNNWVNEIEDASTEIKEVSEQTACAVQEVKGGADIQKDNVGQVNEKMKNLDEGLDKLEDSNQFLETTVEKMEDVTLKGESKIIQVKDQMNNIRSSIFKVANSVDDLSQISQEIDNILEIINNIAKQTNLLALNASIEAARAGKAGNGFNVVANEIRVLSEESADSADRISKLINEIKEETEEAEENMEKGKHEIENGTKVVNAAENAFQDIENALGKVRKGINKSSSVVKKANENSKEIVGNVENIAGITQQTSANAEEVTIVSEKQVSAVGEIKARTEHLSDLTVELNELIKEFNI